MAPVEGAVNLSLINSQENRYIANILLLVKQRPTDCIIYFSKYIGMNTRNTLTMPYRARRAISL